MNFLAPLFLLGLAAVSLPFLLHLRHKQLKKLTVFSSLQFLRPTPIQQKQQSKLEYLLLMLLRCAIFGLLAFAFARPVFKTNILKQFSGKAKQTVILLDSSASMRRGETWSEALEKAKQLVEDFEDSDQVQFISFDSAPRIIHAFDTWQETPSAERKTELLAKLKDLKPSWRETNLGQALIAAADAFKDAAEDPRQDEQAADRTVHLISDLQDGASLEGLAQFPWPLETKLVQERVGQVRDNAAVALLPKAKSVGGQPVEEERFRLTNVRDAKSASFEVVWINADNTPASQPLSFNVAPGNSQIFPAPATTTGVAAPILQISGDAEAFDNRYYRSPPIRRPSRILWLGDDDPNATSSPLFFFQRALIETETFKPELTHKTWADSLDKIDWAVVDLVVLSNPRAEQISAALKPHLEKGGRALFLMKGPDSAPGLAKLLGKETLACTETQPPDFALLGKVDRKHPYLQGFADPRFGDFSKIHFWKYRKLETKAFEKANVLAEFENGDPAWLEIPLGQGQVLAMTSGWHREDSQLALSTKFIPLIYALLTQDTSARGAKKTYQVGDDIPLSGTGEAEITKPSGGKVTLPAGEVLFREADEPGLYQFRQGTENSSVAVNLAAGESLTAPLEADQLEHLLKLDQAAKTEADASGVKDASPPAKLNLEEQESRQKLWMWLLYLVLLLLIVEIIYSARCARPRVVAQT